ncbi:MAG: outer membrane lipoprotein-sorting protein [Candidatus Omnitrophica bacterium]|nr:outer membrane lipoprotein-sorting protein [Candidatus Omnitrophota bacterium]MDD5487821.1 outer membrane lipoprotein-sorting protein [Candidatus Omnitrophota bacterium]
MKNIMSICVVVALVLSAGHVRAAEVDDIVAKANEAMYYQAGDGRADVKMTVTDSLGRTRERGMTILRKDTGVDGKQKYYVYFHQPDDVRGMTYLVWKNVGTDDDRWLYLPALDLVRRVAASDKRSSFVGTNFAYEDISGRGTEEDGHTLLGEENGMYKIKSVPKDPGSVEFSYFITWVDMNDFIPRKAEYYDKNGTLYKTIEALEVKDVGGFPTVVKMKATDFNAGSNTVSEFSDVKYDLGTDENIFSERFLRRPPRQYIDKQ